jgi:hypothetical protein
MGSTLITRAPCSAIIIDAKEAVIMVENSRTVTDSSGFILTPHFFLSGQLHPRSSHPPQSSAAISQHHQARYSLKTQRRSQWFLCIYVSTCIAHHSKTEWANKQRSSNVRNH